MGFGFKQALLIRSGGACGWKQVGTVGIQQRPLFESLFCFFPPINLDLPL